MSINISYLSVEYTKDIEHVPETRFHLIFLNFVLF